MRRIQKENHTPRFVPDYMASSITDIDFKQLADNGVKFIAFDADSTLVHYRGKALSTKTRKYLQEQKKHFKKWCIASNRLTNDLWPLAESIGAELVQSTLTNRKPQRRYFDRVLKHLGSKPSSTAMIGDKMIADMWGAKRAGMVTVWVEHLGRDSLPDRLVRLRRWEKRMLNKYYAEKK